MTYHNQEGQEVEKDFDVAKPEDAEQLAMLVREGRVEHLKADKPINILTLAYDLGVWTLAVFGLLLFILRKLAWKPMLEGLHKREQNIRAALEESKAAREEARHLRDHLAEERAKMGEEVRKALDEARQDARRLKEEITASGRAEVQADRVRLRREIETAKDQALQELWNQTAKLAEQIASKAIRREVTLEDHRRLVDEAMAELGSANVGWKDRAIY